jgi:hypothetical protein
MAEDQEFLLPLRTLKFLKYLQVEGFRFEYGFRHLVPWHILIFPATQAAEAGVPFEPRSLRPAWVIESKKKKFKNKPSTGSHL